MTIKAIEVPKISKIGDEDVGGEGEDDERHWIVLICTHVVFGSHKRTVVEGTRP